MREDLFVHNKHEFVVDVLIKDFCKFLLSLWIVGVSDLALMIFNQVHNVITNVDRRVNERTLLVQGVVVTVN